MKLDPDLIRKILIAYEELSFGGGPIDISDYTQEELEYHQELLSEAGYIEARFPRTFGGGRVMPLRLTYYGLEFLNASRNDKNWEKVKGALFKSGGFVMDIAKSMLIEL